MATAKVWHYGGMLWDGGNRTVPLVAEPPLSRQTVTTSATAAASAAAPAGAILARVEVTVATRYRVRPAGDTTDADANDPALPVGSDVMAVIHLPAGATLSLIEAA